MNLENIVAVSGLPGLYKMAANRSNGLVIEDLDTGKKRFASMRKHQFTPVESIAIYTDDGDSTEIKNVFANMLKNFDDCPPADVKASPKELSAYFSDILPNYDRDRVMIGDIKKVIKWFNYLNSRGYIALTDSAETSEEE